MLKNVASKLIVFAFDSTTNLPKTGDAANITAYVSKDFGSVTVLADTSATEMDATNGKGYYLFDLAQGETNADVLLFSAKSATANIVVIAVPARIDTMTGDAFARLGAPAGASTAADIAAVKADTAAVKAKTDNLPSDPADASDIAAAFSTVNSTLATIAGYIDTEIASIISTQSSHTSTLSTINTAVASHTTTLATIAGYIDTEVAAILATVDTEIAAIKAVTDALGATAAANLSDAFDGTGGVALTLGSIVVSNSAGDAVQLTSTGGNGDALQLTANGTGSAINASGAIGLLLVGTTYALRATGAQASFSITASAGPAIDLSGTYGIYADGSLAGAALKSTTNGGIGLQLVGRTTGQGLLVTDGSNGNAIEVTGGSTSGRGLYVTTTDGHAVELDATGSSKYGLVVDTLTVTGATTLTGGVSATNASNDIRGIALTSAYDFAKGSAAMTEAYATDGAAPTPIQALYMILQSIMEVSISGTTMTIKKLDRSTTAMTVTLNDGTNPTARTRSG